MANPCDNNLYIEGRESDLQSLSDWIHTQKNDQAPTPTWAALYNLEQDTDSMDGIGDVGSGDADHAYGGADFSLHGTTASLQWVSRNNPSIDVVLLLAQRFPALTFQFSYDESGHGLSGQLHCTGGAVTSFEGGYNEDSESDSEEDWYSEEDSDEAPI